MADADRPAADGRADDKVSYALLTAWTNARNLIGRALGQLYNGARDLYATFGYPPEVTYQDGINAYTRQDIVSRVVNAYPDAVWTRPPQVIGNAKLAKGLHDLDEALGLYHYVNRADRLAGLGKYSLLVLGFDDVRDTAGMEKPVRAGAKLSYLQVYGYGNLQIESFEENAGSPHYGMPRVYVVKQAPLMTSSLTGSAVQREAMRIHRSRVIHIADSPLDSDIEGYPIVERVYNRLIDIEKVVGGSAEMFWYNGRKGMQVDIGKDVTFTKKDASKLREELEAFGNDMQRFIRTRGVTMKDLGSQGVNPGPVFNVIMSIISVATGIPQRIFIGSEQGKLASEQDRANWAIRIDERRVLYAEPRILKPLITRLQGVGVLPAGAYTLEWPEAFRMSPLERAQTSAQQARSATNVARAMRDHATPIEGVDYSIRRPTKVFSGGGGFGSKAFAAPPANDKGGPGEQKPTGTDTSSKPAPPQPVEVPVEEIKVARRELISVDEGRAIIFARGELKTEGPIDGVMD